MLIVSALALVLSLLAPRAALAQCEAFPTCGACTSAGLGCFWCGGAGVCALPGNPCPPPVAVISNQCPRTGPQVLYNRTVTLSSGTAQGFPVTVTRDGTLTVNLMASRAVDLMLMTEQEWQIYTRVHGSIFGSTFYRMASLGRQNTQTYSASAPIAPGQYYVVVQRQGWFLGTTASIRIELQ
ncbi:MAG: hypothetical protein WCJ30_11120 [Deltaproteobacteria bacterium]